MRVMPIDDFLEHYEETPGGTRYDWARLVRDGRAARAAADGGAWRIGDLASTVERRYRSGALKRFAREIGESLGTVRRYRWVAAAYDEDARSRFAPLSFSHFQAVVRLGDRLVWLERAQRGTWSVDRLVVESRGGTATSASDVARIARPVESALRSVLRLRAIDDRALARAARHGLSDTIDELAAEVERVRARLRDTRARARLATTNGHRAR